MPKSVFVLIALCLYSTVVTAEEPEKHGLTIKGRIIQEQEFDFDTQIWKAFPEGIDTGSIITGDFNGDGYTDLISRDIQNKSYLVAISNGVNSFTTSTWLGIPEELWWEQTKAVDINADGCSDLLGPTVGWSAYSWWMALSDCKGSFSFRNHNLQTSIQLFSSFTVGDVNDDGRADLILLNAKRPSIHILTTSEKLELAEVSSESLEDRHWEPIHFNAVHLRNNHHLDLLYGLKDGFVYRAQTLKIDNRPPIEATTVTPWAQFMYDYTWSSGILGDFNGDGLSDIITKGSDLAGWWIALSNGKTGLEKSITPPFGEDHHIENVLVGDFDGNSVDEMILCSNNGSCQITFIKQATGVQNVKIFSDTGVETISKSDGSFTLAGLKEGTHKITPQLSGYAFSQQSRIVKLSNQHSAESINFVAVDISEKDGLVGRAIQLAGNGNGPFICLGYHTLGHREYKWKQTNRNCPSGYALFSPNSPTKVEQTSERITVISSCCRLPADDILSDEHLFVSNQCPDGYVGTGGYRHPTCKTCTRYLRCTKINTTRYILGEPIPGVHYGISMSMRSWTSRVETNEIPIAIRFGIGRESENSWSSHGCIGKPWGSLFVRKAPGGCRNYRFRQLQYAGNPGDPARGTPVKMFPDCKSIENIYDPTSGCRINLEGS